MPISPLAGKPAPKELLIDPARLEREYLGRRPDLAGSEPIDQVRHQRPSRLAVAWVVHRSPHPRHHPGDLRLPEARTAPAVRCSWARTHMPFPGRLSAPRWRFWQPTTSRPSSSATTASRRLRSSRGPSWCTITAGPTASPTASSSRRRTTRRRMVGSSTTRPMAARPTRTSRNGLRTRANELLRNGNSGVRRVSFAAAIGAGTTHQEDLLRPYVDDLRNVIDMDAIRAAGLKLAVDPLGGAAVHYWEPINATYGLDITVVNPRGRSDLLVHDRRP